MLLPWPPYPQTAAAQSHLREHVTVPPPPSWGRVGVGVVLSTEDRVERSRRRPHPTLPRLGGGDCSEPFERHMRCPACDGRSISGTRAVMAGPSAFFVKEPGSRPIAAPRRGESGRRRCSKARTGCRGRCRI